MPALIKIAGVPGVKPTLGVFRLLGRLGRLVVLAKQAGRTNQDFASVGQLDLHAFDRWTDSVSLDAPVFLHAHEHRGFGRAIQLLQVDAKRAIESKQIGPDRFAGGVGDSHAAHAEGVPQRRINEPVAERIKEPACKVNRLPIQQPSADVARDAHEVVKHAPLDRRGVFHPDHHLRQQCFEHPRRRKVIGGPDLAHVRGDGRG